MGSFAISLYFKQFEIVPNVIGTKIEINLLVRPMKANIYRHHNICPGHFHTKWEEKLELSASPRFYIYIG